MGMLAKALAGGDAVFVDYPQRAKAHLAGIVIIGEGKGVIGVQPAMIGVSAVLAFADGDHTGSVLLLSNRGAWAELYDP